MNISWAAKKSSTFFKKRDLSIWRAGEHKQWGSTLCHRSYTHMSNLKCISQVPTVYSSTLHTQKSLYRLAAPAAHRSLFCYILCVTALKTLNKYIKFNSLPAWLVCFFFQMSFATHREGRRREKKKQLCQTCNYGGTRGRKHPDGNYMNQ